MSKELSNSLLKHHNGKLDCFGGKIQVISMKGRPCPFKPILCQEGYCQDCQIYLDYQGHQRAMGRSNSLSEIRDDVEHSIDSVLILYESNEIDRVTAREQILSHPNLAIVDRERRQMLKVKNIKVTGHAEKVLAVCPACSCWNYYFFHPTSKFQAIRLCKDCGAVLELSVEEVKDDSTSTNQN